MRPPFDTRARTGFTLVEVVLAMFVLLIGMTTILGLLGFGAAFGFLSCLAMVLVAKALGYVLKRNEDYYDGGGDDA